MAMDLELDMEEQNVKSQRVTAQSVIDFTTMLASPAPIPGGGGASSLVGALSAALGHMVGVFTVGKPKYADAAPSLKAAMTKAEKLQAALLQGVDEDAQAFAPLSRAYSLPKTDPARDEKVEMCLRQAAEVPMHVFWLCCQVIEVLEVFAAKGSAMLISDAATAASLCRGALYGAAINVRVNTRLMKTRQYAESLDRALDETLPTYIERADRITLDIYRRLCDV